MSFESINSYNGEGSFMRHTNAETGVGQWWKPINLERNFPYVGTSKKGGY